MLSTKNHILIVSLGLLLLFCFNIILPLNIDNPMNTSSLETESHGLDSLSTPSYSVSEGLIEFNIGDYICMNGSTGGSPNKLFMNFTYDSYPDPSIILVTNSTDPTSWLKVDVFTRMIVDGEVNVIPWSPISSGFYFPAQIETDLVSGDTINYLNGIGTVEETVWYDWDGIPLEGRIRPAL